MLLSTSPASSVDDLVLRRRARVRAHALWDMVKRRLREIVVGLGRARIVILVYGGRETIRRFPKDLNELQNLARTWTRLKPDVNFNLRARLYPYSPKASWLYLIDDESYRTATAGALPLQVELLKTSQPSPGHPYDAASSELDSIQASKPQITDFLSGAFPDPVFSGAGDLPTARRRVAPTASITNRGDATVASGAAARAVVDVSKWADSEDETKSSANCCVVA